MEHIINDGEGTKSNMCKLIWTSTVLTKSDLLVYIQM